MHKKLVANGIIVVEDAGHTPWLIGAIVALRQFINEVGDNCYTCIQMESGQYVLLKNK